MPKASTEATITDPTTNVAKQPNGPKPAATPDLLIHGNSA